MRVVEGSQAVPAVPCHVPRDTFTLGGATELVRLAINTNRESALILYAATASE